MSFEVEKVDSFVRLKANPGAVISVNKDELQSYKTQRRLREKTKLETQTKFEEINTLKQQVDVLHSEMKDIKGLLIQLLEHNK